MLDAAVVSLPTAFLTPYLPSITLTLTLEISIFMGANHRKGHCGSLEGY